MVPVRLTRVHPPSPVLSPAEWVTLFWFVFSPRPESQQYIMYSWPWLEKVLVQYLQDVLEVREGAVYTVCALAWPGLVLLDLHHHNTAKYQTQSHHYQVAK